MGTYCAHVTNAINSKSSLYLRSRRQLHTAGHYPLAGSVQHLAGLSCSRRGEERQKLMPYLRSSSLRHLTLPGTGAGLRPAAPGDRADWAAAERGDRRAAPRGKSPGNWRGSCLPNISPSRLPCSQKGPSLRSDGQGPASSGPPPVPAVGKRLRASVSPSCRRRPILLAYFPKHLQTGALCW